MPTDLPPSNAASSWRNFARWATTCGLAYMRSSCAAALALKTAGAGAAEDMADG